MIFNQEAKRQNSIRTIAILNNLLDCLCREKKGTTKLKEKQVAEMAIIKAHQRIAQETKTLIRLTRGHMKMGIM